MVLNAVINMSCENFIDQMWSDSSLWHKMMAHTGEYDFELIEKNNSVIKYQSKLKMLNWELPKSFKVPSFCQQVTNATVTKTDSSLTIELVTTASGFPMSDAFQIFNR